MRRDHHPRRPCARPPTTCRTNTRPRHKALVGKLLPPGGKVRARRSRPSSRRWAEARPACPPGPGRGGRHRRRQVTLSSGHRHPPSTKMGSRSSRRRERGGPSGQETKRRGQASRKAPVRSRIGGWSLGRHQGWEGVWSLPATGLGRPARTGLVAYDCPGAARAPAPWRRRPWR